jgi:hypothetical protein
MPDAIQVPDHVQKGEPRVPNPVNPGEDFADKWAAKPELEQNLSAWHARVCRDFDAIASESDPTRLIDFAESRFAVALSEAPVGRRPAAAVTRHSERSTSTRASADRGRRRAASAAVIR